MSSVQQFCEDLTKIDLKDPKAKEVMMEKIKQYDENFAQSSFYPTPSQLSQNYKRDTSKIQLPQNGSEMEKQLKTQFIADGSIFGEYQSILRQAHVPAFVVPPPPPPKLEEQAAQIFLRIPYNYLDQNANTKFESNIQQQPQNQQLSQISNFLSTIHNQNQLNQSQIPKQQQQVQNPSAIQASILNNQQQMDLQMQINQTPNGLDSDFITNIKKTVNVLGGIEDTVQIMKQSLQDYELQHQIERKIDKQPIFKNSTLMNPQNTIQSQINQQQYHPFERYMATEQLQVVQQSQKLRESKLQQNIHQ